jgi:2-dehydro-3-deoxyphosphogluconate aldolase/(4S)-4-hydroxy-2-oxoglutarate aldolase
MLDSNNNNPLAALGFAGVVPVITISTASKAARLGQALLEGGLACAEITFRTEAAETAIGQMIGAHPEILVGAGTVLTIDQARRAMDAGARFIVSPGFEARVVTWCLDNGIPIVPGVATPTEINMALEYGLEILKFFPASAFGGVTTLKAIAAPYHEVKFIPTGGVNAQNLAEYLRLSSVLACGGSWLVKHNTIEDGKFDQITRLSKEAVEIVRQVREKEAENER